MVKMRSRPGCQSDGSIPDVMGCSLGEHLVSTQDLGLMLSRELAAPKLYPYTGSWTFSFQASCTHSANTFFEVTQLL